MSYQAISVWLIQFHGLPLESPCRQRFHCYGEQGHHCWALLDMPCLSTTMPECWSNTAGCDFPAAATAAPDTSPRPSWPSARSWVISHSTKAHRGEGGSGLASTTSPIARYFAW